MKPLSISTILTKTVFWMFLIIMTINAFAETVTIRIKNASTSDCTLKNRFITFGELVQNTQPPETLFRDQTATFKMDGFPASIVLTYECGDDKDISFFSHNGAFHSRWKILQAQNMAGDFEEKRHGFLGSWTFTWTLKDADSLLTNAGSSRQS